MGVVHCLRLFGCLILFAMLVEVGNPSSASAALTTIRIDSGAGSTWTDGAGIGWEPDRGYIGGEVVDRGAITIANSSAPALYRTERFGLSGYGLPVANGTYNVTLRWAETYEGITGPGQRIFDMNVEGVGLSGIDPYAMAGGRNRAVSRTIKVVVGDGQLNMQFQRRYEQPMINAFEIVPVPVMTATTPAPPKPATITAPPATTTAPSTTTSTTSTSTSTSTTSTSTSTTSTTVPPPPPMNPEEPAPTASPEPASMSTAAHSAKKRPGALVLLGVPTGILMALALMRLRSNHYD